jgi:hypothetical protein
MTWPCHKVPIVIGTYHMYDTNGGHTISYNVPIVIGLYQKVQRVTKPKGTSGDGVIP